MMRLSAAVALLFILFIGDLPAHPAADTAHVPPPLRLAGDLNGTSSRDVSYAKLLRLPREHFTVSDDPNFTHPAQLSGVDLDVLSRTFGARGKKILVAAMCDDGYEAHYTAEYRAAHHPFLVLTIDGHSPDDLPRNSAEGSYGPYLISHAHFAPQFRALSHEDQQEVPNGVIELRFFAEDQVLRALQAPGSGPSDATMKDASIIALQNCLRCHGRSGFGGTKSPFNWEQLAASASRNPRRFASYIHDPSSQKAKSTMPGNPGYDARTLHALTTYFQSFAAKVKP
jgi:hypothetical protein